MKESIEDLFGEFKAELWEADEFVITCKHGVIGHTIDKRDAAWLPFWLNSAIKEALENKSKKEAESKRL